MASSHVAVDRSTTVPGRPRRGSRTTRRTASLEGVSFDCDALADLEPRGVGFTYWFDPPEHGGPVSVRVRFAGRRIGVRGKPGRRDTFEVVERIERVVPGSGPVALTVHVPNVTDGEWQVTAAGDVESGRGRTAARLGSASSSSRTGYAPVIRVKAPGARLFAWPALVSVGVAIAVVVQWLLARDANLPAGRISIVSLLSSLVGLVGAKVYYLVEHRAERPTVLRAGLCIQGFVLATIGALIAGSVAIGVPVGRVLDVTVPGLLFAMTIGRFGCFFGGCCAGRATPSRWGLWSSDRRLGMRRIPTQLLESAVAFTIGLAALAVVTSFDVRRGGTVFVAAIAAYTLGRQLLFPLRDLPRHTDHGRFVTMAIAAAAVVAAIAVNAFA